MQRLPRSACDLVRTSKPSARRGRGNAGLPPGSLSWGPGQGSASQALNDARDTLARMSRDGLLPIFALMAEHRRRTGSNATASTVLVVMLIIAPAGAGKTFSWAREIAARGVRRPAVMQPGQVLHVILASPTILLINQTAEALVENGLTEPIVTVVHGEVAKTGVATEMRRYFSETPTDCDAVLLCSHAGIFDTPLPPDPQVWDIVFDEVPDAATFLSIDAPDTHIHVTRHVTVMYLARNKMCHLTPHGDELAKARLTRIARIARLTVALCIFRIWRER